MGRNQGGCSARHRRSHAIFECLAHNLLLLFFEQYLSQSEGLRDELEEKKQQDRSKATVIASVAAGIIRTSRNFSNTALTRATQVTQRFIRWVLGLDLQRSSPAGFHRPPEASLGHNLSIVFHTDRFGV